MKEVNGQESYYYSPTYEIDTAAYEATKRRLIKQYDGERRQQTKPLELENGAYFAAEFASQRAMRRSEGWDVECVRKGLEYYEHDSLKTTYDVPCSPLYMDWKREIVKKIDKYRNGEICTSGEFLILTWMEASFATPINKHKYYSKRGKIRSIATFTSYGKPICDSLFNSRGKFKCVKPIDWYDRVPKR